MSGRCRLPNLSRFDVRSRHRSRFPNRIAREVRPCGFPLFETRWVQSGVWRHVKCSPVESTLLIYRGRRPLKGGGRIAGASRSCQRIARLLKRSTDLPRRTASIGSSSARGSCAAAPLSRGVPLPANLTDSAAWPNKCGGLLRVFASLGGAPGVQIPFAVFSHFQGVLAFPRC
jgi:hypothetical protein